MDNSKIISQNLEEAFDKIIQHIMNGKGIDFFSLIDSNCGNDYNIIYKHISCIKVMTFYLAAEHKQAKKLTDLIELAINNYVNSSDDKNTISSNELNKNIDINLNNVYRDFDKVYGIFKADLSDSIRIKLDLKDNESIIFLLNMLSKHIDNNGKQLFLTYIPAIIYAFYTNYKKGIKVCIQKLMNKKMKENDIHIIVSLLTKIPNKVSKYQMRDYERKEPISLNSFLFVSLYNAIITNYKKNFIVDFLWFERNVGFYQYYLTESEYSQIINYISHFEPTDLNPRMDISIPTALYLNVKDNLNIDDETLWETFDLIISDNTPTYETSSILKEIFTGTKNNSEISSVKYEDVIKYFKSYPHKNPDLLKNRFMIHNIQSLYYHELLTKENFIKRNNSLYSFYCDEISDNDFKLKDVRFDLWYTSDDIADMYFNIIKADDKYYIVSPVLNNACSIEPEELWLNDSIILVKRAKSIWLKGNLIGKKATTLLKLEKAKFNNLSIEYQNADYDVIDCFTSKKIVESFSKINETDINKIYVFFGLHYFTNIEDYPQGRRNIIALYVNGLMGYQNFFPIRGTFDYNEMPIIINRYLRNLRIYGSSTASGCSTSCSGSSAICTSNNISTSCNTVQGISAVGITRSCSGSYNATASSEAEQKNEK